MDGVESSLGNEREKVVFFTDRETGLRGITVVDDTRLTPSVGACRSRPYDEEERALADALRQARTTSAKALIAGLPVGGGCTVLLDDPSADNKATSPMPAIGRAVEALGGSYRLMPDLQGDLRDMDLAATTTSHVLGRSGQAELDAIEATAIGIRFGIEVAVQQRLGRQDLMGVRVGISGLGEIGFRLAELLRQEGARLTVADRDPRRTERAVRALGISCVTTEEIIHLESDVLATCAAKDVIDDWSLSHLRCQIVAGGVDDPLKSPEHGQGLHDRGILFAPDTIINAGGLISLTQPLISEGGASENDAESTPTQPQLQAIGTRLDHLIARAVKENQPTSIIAERMAEEALAARIAGEPARSLAS